MSCKYRMGEDHMFDFSGQTVIVTGGTRGIGRAVVEAFLASGARVIASYVENDEAAKALQDDAYFLFGADLAAGDPFDVLDELPGFFAPGFGPPGLVDDLLHHGSLPSLNLLD